MNKMKVIMFYETVPESSDVYLLDIPAAEFELIKHANGLLVNNDEMNTEQQAACDVLNFALVDIKSQWFEQFVKDAEEIGIDKAWVGKYHGFKLDMSKPVLDVGNVDAIITTGFYL